MAFYDSHCHLDPMRYGDDLPQVLARARAAGVTKMTIIGTRAADSLAAADLAAREPGLVSAAGIHPNDVAGVPADEWDRVGWLVSSISRRLARNRDVSVSKASGRGGP